MYQLVLSAELLFGDIEGINGGEISAQTARFFAYNQRRFRGFSCIYSLPEIYLLSRKPGLENHDCLCCVCGVHTACRHLYYQALNICHGFFAAGAARGSVTLYFRVRNHESNKWLYVVSAGPS